MKNGAAGRARPAEPGPASPEALDTAEFPRRQPRGVRRASCLRVETRAGRGQQRREMAPNGNQMCTNYKPGRTHGWIVPKTTEVKVRLDDEEEAILARLARDAGINRSEVLRRSLRAYEERQREDVALDHLVKWAEVDENRLAGKKPKKTRFRME